MTCQHTTIYPSRINGRYQTLCADCDVLLDTSWYGWRVLARVIRTKCRWATNGLPVRWFPFAHS